MGSILANVESATDGVTEHLQSRFGVRRNQEGRRQVPTDWNFRPGDPEAERQSDDGRDVDVVNVVVQTSVGVYLNLVSDAQRRFGSGAIFGLIF